MATLFDNIVISTMPDSPPRPTTAPASSPAKRRRRRQDGDVTRAEIIEIAGRLFAVGGYFGTTSKAICEQAGVNLAAINYHFESRDGLYLAVLREVHQRFISLAFLQQISGSGLPPGDKLRRFLQELIRYIIEGESWPMQVWAREVVAPTPLLDNVMRELTQPKFEALSSIISEITAIPRTDPRLPRLVLSVIAPCIIMLITERHKASPIKPLFASSPSALADGLWRFAMAGLNDIKRDQKSG